MRPHLVDGDLLLIDSTPGPFQPGDLVLLTVAGAPCLHRLVAEGEVKGDRNADPDPLDPAGPRGRAVARLVYRADGSLGCHRYDGPLARATARALTLFSRLNSRGVPLRGALSRLGYALALVVRAIEDWWAAR